MLTPHQLLRVTSSTKVRAGKRCVDKSQVQTTSTRKMMMMMIMIMMMISIVEAGESGAEGEMR